MKNKIHIRDKSDLLKIKSFNTTTYEDFSLTSLTAYCVFNLREWNITTSLENISVASHRMFPVKFSLVGWPNFPDITRTSRSVLQMRPKYRNLATSASGKGVFLNQNGIKEAFSVLEKIGPPLLIEGGRISIPANKLRAERGKSKKPRSVHPEDLVSTIYKSQLFGLYDQSRFDEAEAIHLIGLLKVYDHTPSLEKRRKLKELLDAAKDLEDKEALDFLNLASQRFYKYLNK